MSMVHVVRDRADEAANAKPVDWALLQLTEALAAAGSDARQATLPAAETHGEPDAWVAAGTPRSATARAMLDSAGVSLPSDAEALAIAPGRLAGRRAVLACAADVRGLVYAVLELADRVRCSSSDPLSAMIGTQPIVQQPANTVRSIARLFASDVEDKAWFYDRSFWQDYLTMLAGQRINRFHLALGLGYDFVRNVRDAYFLFPYPFFLDVPGYAVRVEGLPDDERAHNLDMLRFISEETARRGLHFQLGLWMHAYAWVDSPDANYTIAGVTPDNHAAYCRDALRLLLEACPAIDGVTFRVHGESGVAEGNYDFWRTVFDGVVQAGRKIEINLHPKGVDQQMIDTTLATGMPVTISPKYTAEHMGLPYQQASIRERERVSRHVPEDRFIRGLMALSEGSLRYTRYGYADFLKNGRRYGVFGRMWPGTQRVLLWGDPALAAGYGRHAHLAGCLGLEFFEPLTFKGRLGSGSAGDRAAYADAALRPRYDFEKYLYTYRLLGRLLYDPDAPAEQWRRYLAHEYGAAAPAVEQALAHASRILPLVTSAHLPSAHYGWYWPEVYTNLPIVEQSPAHSYRDSDAPVRFSNVSALDPAVFARAEEFVDETLRGESSGRYSPLRVAAWLNSLAAAAAAHLADAQSAAPDPGKATFRQLALDVSIQSGLGRFFANKLRAGVGYAFYMRTQQTAWLRQAVAAYHVAIAAWRDVAAATSSVYGGDITFGLHAHGRGHWRDRLPVIEADLAAMEAELRAAEAARPEREASSPDLASLDEAAPPVAVSHVPPSSFSPGRPLPIEIAVGCASTRDGAVGVHLHYRRVNQAEPYVIAPMTAGDESFRAVIPGPYTQSPYDLLYFFRLSTSSGKAWLYPGFAADLANQPYVVVQQKNRASSGDQS